MNKKRRNICIVLMTLLIMNIVGTLWKKVTEEKTGPNKYGIEKGEIIAEIHQDDTTDVIVKEGNKLTFYSYKVLGKKCKEIIAFSSDNSFDYMGLKNEEKNMEKRIESLQVHIHLMSSFYSDIYRNVERRPYCGVSVSSEIYNLKLNDQQVEKIIDYQEGNQRFYIWYFSDLNIDYTLDYPEINVDL